MPGPGRKRRIAVEIDEAKIDAIFARFDQCHLPGAAVGIAVGGRPVYRKGFGLASMELPLCLAPSTRVRIGSATKSFTCLACMLLCEEGKARPDEPLGKFLPELNPAARAVTLRQVMGHTSGMRDALALISQFRGHIGAHIAGCLTSSAEVLTLYRDIDDIDAPPGSTWIYNNGAYLLLSVAIERIADQALEQVMSGRIFRPLGMFDTQIRRFDTDFLPNSASTHQRDASGSFGKAYFGYDYAGGGAIVSTVDDMLRWLANMDSGFVGSAATWAAIKTPQILTNGTSSGYGMGLRAGRYRGMDTLFHGGGWVGSQTQMLKVPAAGLDVVIMANRSDVPGPSLLDQVLDTCIPDLTPARPRTAGPFAAGTFHSPQTGRVIQLFERDGRQIASMDGWDMAVEPDDRGVLWPPERHGFMKFGITRSGDGVQPMSLRFSDFGNPSDLERVAPAIGPKPTWIVGQYRADAIGFEALVVETEAGLRMRTATRLGSTELELEWLGERIWRARSDNSLDAILVFEPEGSAFRYSDAFTRSLRFRRCG